MADSSSSSAPAPQAAQTSPLNGFVSLNFNDTSSAGSATINLNSADGGINFGSASSAGTATITVNEGNLSLWQTSTLGSATVTNNRYAEFQDTSSAGSASITNNRHIQFHDEQHGR